MKSEKLKMKLAKMYVTRNLQVAGHHGQCGDHAQQLVEVASAEGSEHVITLHPPKMDEPALAQTLILRPAVYINVQVTASSFIGLTLCNV